MTCVFSQMIEPVSIVDDSLACFNASAIKAFRKMKERKAYLEQLTTDQQIIIGNWEKSFAEQAAQLQFYRTQIEHFEQLDKKSQNLHQKSQQQIENLNQAYQRQRKQNRWLKWGGGGAVGILLLKLFLP